jgi:UPF0716 protein FxsA
MFLVKWAFIGLVLLPAAEIAAFMVVAVVIGWSWAILLFLATSVLGVMLLRRSGRADLDRLRGAIRRDGIGAIHFETPGVATVIAGILLVFPGFITDVIGALLLVPPLRRMAVATIGRALKKRQQRRRTSDRTVIDLAPDEWHQVSERKPRQRRRPRDPDSESRRARTP